MKFNLLFLLLMLNCSVAYSQDDPSALVDPFIGTGGHGHTYPGATLPFGMVQLSPDTRNDGSWDGCSGYHYDDSLVLGFSHTHLSGTGCSDYGDILLMPFSGKKSKVETISSRLIHANESALPGYYSLKLDDGTKVELTTTLRVGVHRYTFAKSSGGFLIDLMHRDEVLESALEIVDATHLKGFRRSKAWAGDQLIYFYITLSQPLTSFHFIDENEMTFSEAKKYSGKKIKGFIQFENIAKPLIVKVAISSVSTDGAKQNMQTETTDFNFNKIKIDARQTWYDELSKIQIEGGTAEQQKIFYTALYHCLIVPNIYEDVDGRYRGSDFKIHTAVGFHRYTVFSLWDTFRAWHPLMTILAPDRVRDFIQTFLSQYDESGLLPVWELSSNETECMIGYHSVSVIADAYAKGIRNFDTEKALAAMKKSAETATRFGLASYMKNGYIDRMDESESVSKSLEYAYDDWCISRFANSLNHKEDAQRFLLRSEGWKNLYDKDGGFMRPRDNGGWLKPFDPYEVNGNYTEANAWQYSFFVPQDVNGLIKYSGGKEKFTVKLDSLFSTHPKTTGRDQADITGLIGQYAHGNEPSHHMAYLYDYVDAPYKTQEMIHRIVNEMYHAQPDGLSGNEDCGQMSGWLVMSAFGIYPVTPGSTEYVFGTPMFPKATINLVNGKKFSIQADGISPENYFIKNIQLNGEKWNKIFLSHEQIAGGGELVFTMSSQPDKTSHYEIPPVTTLDDVNYLKAPVIQAEEKVFKDSMLVTITADEGKQIHYTIDGSEPNSNSSVYAKPFYIKEKSRVEAQVFQGENKSKVTSAQYFKNLHPDWKIVSISNFHRSYNAGGAAGIIDGLEADLNWQKGGWQGYQLTDFEVIIDMGKEETVRELFGSFLQDTRSWILMPTNISIELSSDNVKYTPVLNVPNKIPADDYTIQIQKLGAAIPKQNARYIKVKATNYGQLPSWHPGHEGFAFIFVDEIIAK